MDSSLTFPASRNLLFILLAVLQVIGVVENKCSVNQACCVPKSPMRVEENNPMGFVVSNITINEPPVTISDPAAVPEVAVVGSTLQLTTSIDFENLKTPVLLFNLECGMTLEMLPLIIEIRNVNDNPPMFPEKVLNLNISELFPVGEPWETVTANDPDNDLIFYSLESTTNGDNYFYLKTENTPEIILDKSLHYEKIKNLQLILHAWEHLDSTSPNDTVTINIQVLDEDNKPPVFLPCSPVANSPASICLNAAYEGNITQETVEKDPLQLQPQQIQAVDGDEGINAVIQYSIIDGAPDNAFNINPSNGAITMTKAVTSLDPIVLTVMAYQVNDHYKYTTTTVTLNVLRLSHYSPQFAKEIYDGTIQENSEAGSIVIGQGSTTKPLQVQAEDYDFPNSSNPSIKYEITPSDHFTINRDGFIFTKTELPAAVSLYDLTVTVTDVENGETNKTQVKVQVIRSNAPTTVTTITQGTGPTKPPTKPAGTGPTTTGASTSSKAPPTAPTTVKTPTTHGTGPSKPPPKPPGTGPTTTGASTPSKPPPGPPGSTAAKPPGPGTGPTPGSPAINPRLMYEAKHMAALGVPLAILLIICLIIIGILLNKLYPGKLKWKTIKERTGAKLKFFSRSSYSSKSDKMQFTNEDYLEKGSPNRPHKASWLSLENPPIIESTALASVLDSTVENSSTTGSSGNQTDPTSQRANTAPTAQKDKDTSSSLDQTDYDQEMKSILTKERKSDEGYKSVWFKEDIEPAANEEHVIDRHDDEEEAEEDDHDPGDRDRDGGDLTGHGYFLRMQSDDAASIAL
ncbi:cadherin-related family member 5-like isoform X5 [Heterodontus francisci]|uniref:cadherin-related family member 5-like isoform X5 n=1 Tax=Heterodontus francisci TaxID=7792 RepID=UPI00355B97DA